MTTYSDRLAALLALRHATTQKLIGHAKCCPEYIYDRARVYQALDYDDLAAFDAYTVHLLALKHLNPDEFVTDLQAYDVEGAPWQPHDGEAREWFSKAMRILVPCLDRLGATRDAETMLAMWSKPPFNVTNADAALDHFPATYRNFVGENTSWSLSRSEAVLPSSTQPSRLDQAVGSARREIYPWSTFEPDRNSQIALDEINASLSTVAPKLEARVTVLRDLTDPTKQWKQLGLFAREDLKPGEQVLREKSLITAIRPLEDAICDACGQDLEAVPAEERCECDGYDCDITFCSWECKDRASREYHVPKLEEEEEEDYNDDDHEEPEGGEEEEGENEGREENLEDNSEDAGTQHHPNSHTTHPAPFCSNQDNLSSIGRLQTTTTPEPDLYFLLLTRVTAMSITQQTHPLLLPSIKYLWGDFTSTPSTTRSSSVPPIHTSTLPFSLTHTIALPLEYFSTLSLTHPAITPYSPHWLQTFDSWILQTLLAKFRGVANAIQSSFDGKPEIAMVHPNWCLANHSCAPNVSWKPVGVRTFTVRTRYGSRGTDNLENGDTHERDADGGEEEGIRRDQEIFSHYTDISLDVAERRDRLRDVLGGECVCARCERESKI